MTEDDAVLAALWVENDKRLNELADQQDAEEREAVRGMVPAPHYELNDGTCVSCGQEWICPGYSEQLAERERAERGEG